MSQTASRNSPDTFTIVNEVNDHGAATLRSDNGSTFHVTSYENSSFRDYLANHHAGDRVRMDIERAGVRANVWQVSALYPGANE
ncbi:hypothetical protein C5B90_10795 [Haloferax sp. Atlit-12N]|uniref:hypothetical protein n=1 Tax=Haloferax sp. Atlit-12N TaxID=2077203 RepID=UPI000E263CC1|nr:hypothetical protein [Haloferax sp. Atlit-12N]RDZ63615.1 hypothetical protein C5B90_10795 [Haloferax sp. Atlit-12N]